MQFENKKFEKNISRSQESLEKFKKELNFDDTSKGLKNFSRDMNNIDFSTMTSNIQKLTDKFTGLGTASEFILSRIRRELEQLGDRAIAFGKSMTFDQIGEGQQKFESLNKSVRTIMAATGEAESKVYEVMERLNTYTDWTSYSFSDMAQNIGKFTSIGIPLEKAEMQMEGIANWAARSGAGIAEASRAMYNLSQSMGMGHLELRDWRSIENAGMATKEFKEQLIQAGVAAGTLVKETKKDANGIERTVYKTSKALGKQVEVNYSNMSSTLSKKWASSDVIGNTLLGYYQYELLPEEERKMMKLSDEQKEMFSKVFQDSSSFKLTDWESISKQEGLGTDEIKQRLLDVAEAQGTLTAEIQEDGTKIYTTLDKNKKEIKFTAEEFEKGLGGTWLTKNVANVVYHFDTLASSSYHAAKECKSLTDVFQAWRDYVSTGFMATFQHIFGGLTESVQMFSAMCNKVSDVILNTFAKGGTVEKVFEYWEKAGGRENLWGLIIGEYEDDDGNILYEGAYGLIDILADIKKLISDAFWEVIGVFAGDELPEDEMVNWMEDPEYRAQYLGNKIADVSEKIHYFIQSVKDYFNEIPEGANKSRWETIKDVIKIVFHVVGLAAQAIEGIFVFFGKVREMFKPVTEALGNLFRTLVGDVLGTSEQLNKDRGIVNFFAKLAEFLRPVITVIANVVAKVIEMISAFIKWGKESGFFERVWEGIKTVFTEIWKVVSAVATPIIDFVSKIFDAFKELFAEGFTPESWNNFKEKIKTYFIGMWEGIKTGIGPATENIRSFFAKVWEVVSKVVSQYFENENTIGGKVWKWLKGVFESLKNTLDKVFPGASKSIGAFFKKIGDFVTGIFTGKTDILQSLKKFWDKIVNGVHDFFTRGFPKTLANIWEKIKDFFSGIFGPKSDAKKTTKDIKNMVTETADTVNAVANVSIGSGEKSTLGEAVTNILNKINEFFSNITPLHQAIIGAFVGWFMIRDLLKKVKGITGDIASVATAGKKDVVKPINSYAMKILMIGAAVALVANSLIKIGSIPLAQAIQGAAGVAVILALMGGFTMIMKTTFHGNAKKGVEGLSGKDVLKMAFTMIAISIAVGRMVKAMEPLAKYNKDQLIMMGLSMAAIMTSMGVLAYAAGKAKFDWKAGAGFLLFAWSVGVLISSLEAILKFRDAEGNIDWQALELMAGTLGVVILAFSILARSAKKNEKSIIGLAGMAAAIAILVLALQSVANMELTGIAKMLGTFIVIMGVMLAFVKLFPKGGTLKDSALWQMIPLAIGIWLIMQALLPIADIGSASDWSGVTKMMAVYSVVMIGLIALIAVINRTASDKNSRGLKKSGLGSLILLAAGIWLIISSLRKVADIGTKDDWSGLLKMMSVYALIMVGLIALVAVVNKTDNGGKNRGLKKTGIFFGILGIVIGISSLLKVLAPLANLGWDQVFKMMAPFALIMLSLIVFTNQVGELGRKGKKNVKPGTEALKIIAGLIVFFVAVYAIMRVSERMSADKLLIVFGGLALLMLSIGHVMNNASKFDKKSKQGLQGLIALIGIAGVIWVFGETLNKVKDVDSGKMLAFAASVLIIGITIGIVSKSFNKIKASSNSKQLVRKLAEATIAILAIAAIMWLFSELIHKTDGSDAAGMLAFSASIVLLAVALAVVVKAINGIKAPSSSKALGKKLAVIAVAVLAIAGIMFVLSEVIGKVKGVDPKTMLAFGASVLLISGAIALIALVFPLLGKMNVKGVAIAAVALVAIGTALGLVIDIIAGFAASAIEKMSAALATMGTALKWFQEDVELVEDTTIQRGMDMLYKLCDLAVYILNKGDLSKHLDSFAVAMARLGSGVDLFYRGLNGHDTVAASNQIEGIKKMSEDMAGLKEVDGAADILTAIGGAIKVYSQAIGDKTAFESTPDADKIREVLTSLSQAIPEDELLEDVAKNADPDKAKGLISYATGLGSIAAALEAFSESAASIDFEKVKAAIGHLEEMSSLASEEKKTSFDIGGFLHFEQTVTKDLGSLGTLATDIPNLGRAISAFATEIGGIPPEQWDKIPEGIKVLGKFAGIAEVIPYTGGFLQMLVGAPNLELFALQMPNLGRGLKEFCKEIVGAPGLGGEAQTAADVLEKLAIAANKMPPNNGLFQKFSSKDVSKFGDEIPKLGTGVKGFADAIEDIPELSYNKLNSATKILIGICSAANKIPPNSGFIASWSNIDYDTFGSESMSKLGVGVVKFADEIKELDTSITSTQLKVASEVLLAICTAASRIPYNEGLFKTFAGIEYSTFAGDMETLGNGLVRFVEATRSTSSFEGYEADEIIEIYRIMGDLLSGISSILVIIGDATRSDEINMLYTYGKKFGGFVAGLIDVLRGAAIAQDESGELHNYLSLFSKDSELAGSIDLLSEFMVSAGDMVHKLSEAELGLQWYGVSDFMLPTIINSIITAFQKIMTNDDLKISDDADTVVTRCSNILGAINGISDLLVSYNTPTGGTEASGKVIELMQSVLTGYTQFVKGTKSTQIMKNAEWTKDTASVYQRITGLVNMLSDISRVAQASDLSNAPSMFANLAKAYQAFVDQLSIFAQDPDAAKWLDDYDTIINRISSIVGIMSQANSIDVQPTISPVFDFDYARAQFDEWKKNNMLDSEFGTNYSFTMKFDTEQLAVLTPNNYSMDLLRIYESLQNMESKVENVEADMRNMKFYLNTGALAGALTPYIDVNLGRNAFLAGRGRT